MLQFTINAYIWGESEFSCLSKSRLHFTHASHVICVQVPSSVIKENYRDLLLKTRTQESLLSIQMTRTKTNIAVKSRSVIVKFLMKCVSLKPFTSLLVPSLHGYTLLHWSFSCSTKSQDYNMHSLPFILLLPFICFNIRLFPLHIGKKKRNCIHSSLCPSCLLLYTEYSVWHHVFLLRIWVASGPWPVHTGVKFYKIVWTATTTVSIIVSLD